MGFVHAGDGEAGVLGLDANALVHVFGAKSPSLSLQKSDSGCKVLKSDCAVRATIAITRALSCDVWFQVT